MSVATRNVEPIAGYTLRERIGSGGYGEVWKADAPGGLSKAIKLVYGYADGDRASRELKAMGLIKTLRHPFLLSLERIEIVDGQLLIVTELADCSLKDRFERRRSEGLRGIPRPELLQFMRDAADALDYMNEQHSLQHLDVKPENLLLVGEHVKVADFGLVKDVQQAAASMLGGLTPMYASPELFSSAPSRRSDQYSLAIVYQEMLTGVLPFPGKTAAQLAAQHLNAKPLLFSLPPGERKVIARALAKDSSQRFANCRELVEHLQSEVLQASLPAPESWFGKGAPAREEEEPVNSTMCLSTDRLSAPMPKPLTPVEVTAIHTTHAEPYNAGDESFRSEEEMLIGADEASERLNSEFSPTYVMRRSREPRIDCVPAPPVDDGLLLRPTLIIGIGHVAGIVMQRLRQKQLDRLGESNACPAVQFLYLDSDPQGLQQATLGQAGTPLESQDVMLLGLRKSQEYRNEGPSLLKWLSRRWLFNIPRSQTPEGMRPLGRLALADHSRNLRERIRKALLAIQADDACQASQRECGVEFSRQPRVVVVGAICGGTAGGMMLDVCFIARQLLERQGNPNRDVVGMMLHYRGRQSTAHELALVNTYATLAELDYYCRPERPYPGDASCGLDARRDDHAPLSEGYFVHLGDFLTDAELASSADRVAEYLYLDTFTNAARFFAASRQATPCQNERGLNLRTFGLSQISFASGELAPWAAQSICCNLIDHWLGEDKCELGDAADSVRPASDEFLQKCGLQYEELLQTWLAQISRTLGENSDEQFRSLLHGEGKPLTAAALAEVDFSLVRQRLEEHLPHGDKESANQEIRLPVACKAMLALLESSVAKQSQELSRWMIAQSDLAGPRVRRAEVAAGQAVERLASLHHQAAEQRKQIQECSLQLEQLLSSATAMSGRISLRKSPQDYEAKFLEYCHLRLFDAALLFVQEFMRRTKNAVAGTKDKLLDVRRDLKGLRTQLLPAELDESEIATADPLRKVVLDEFTSRKAGLVRELDAWFQPLLSDGGGFSALIGRGGEHRVKLTEQLLQASRQLILRSLQNLDVTCFLLQSNEPGEKASGQRLREAIDDARPRPMADGQCRTLLAAAQSLASGTSSQALTQAVAQHCGATPAVVGYGHSDVAIVSEVAGLSIADVAVRLIDERADFIECAKRVFVRSDIPFEPLTLKEDEQ
jgi:serine/threonine protein kinase